MASKPNPISFLLRTRKKEANLTITITTAITA
jgi:hypothetical protein